MLEPQEHETTYQKAWRLRQTLDKIIADLERATHLRTLKYAEASPLAVKIEADAAIAIKAAEAEMEIKT